jgi:hypothetical protein
MNKQTIRFIFYTLIILMMGICADVTLTQLITKNFSWITLLSFITNITFTTYLYFQVMNALNENDDKKNDKTIL